MELFKNVGIMKITKDKLAEMILKSLNEQVEEGKLGRALAGLGLAATLATTPSCSYFNHYEPHWEHEGPYSAQEKMDKTWNTHNERGDWENVEPGVGFIYDCYTRCANSGGGWTIHVIFADKSTGKFILPQECREYLDGRYMPNCNCFENENTTDRVNTNGLQRLDGSENTTVFENKNRHNMKRQTIKLNESQLRQMIKESLKELDWKTYKNAANKRLAQGKYTNANELSDMAKNRFDDEFNDNYRYDTLGAKLAGKHSKTFNSTFIPTEEPRLQGRNEKGEELFRNNGRYYNSRRGLTTPEKFFKDKEMSDTFNTATQELDDYNNGNYDYTPDKGWHLKESKLRNFIKESIKKSLKEGESIVEFNNLDAIFNEKFGDTVRISRFYSDVNNVVVAVQRQAYGTIAEKVTSIMDEFGYTLSDVGANDEVVMMTFGVANNAQNEPVASTINESKLINMIKESIKKTLKESVIKSRKFLDAGENVCYGEDEMSFFAANYLRKEFRRFPNIAQAKACAQEMLQREKQRRAEEMPGLRY